MFDDWLSEWFDASGTKLMRDTNRVSFHVPFFMLWYAALVWNWYVLIDMLVTGEYLYQLFARHLRCERAGAAGTPLT